MARAVLAVAFFPMVRCLRLIETMDQCAGTGDECVGNQCCPGFSRSDGLTFPCPSADEDWDECQTSTRFEFETISAVGDPHVTSVTGEKFDVWKIGWSTFVQIPRHVDSHNSPKLLVTGNVRPYGKDPCAPSFLQEVTITGSSFGYHRIKIRAGSLESEEPFGITVNGSKYKTIRNASGTKFFSSAAFNLVGEISEDEPGVWGPDAKLTASAGETVVEVKQHTEGRGSESTSMLDLSVSGLDGVSTVGGWLGIDGSMMAGEAPEGCGRLALISVPPPIRHGKSQTATFTSFRR